MIFFILCNEAVLFYIHEQIAGRESRAEKMKRKLDENDVPSPANAPSTPNRPQTFENLDLDSRLLKAVQKENYSVPTPVQRTVIPAILEGRDVLGTFSARTGPELMLTSSSTSKDWLWQNRSIRPPTSSTSSCTQIREAVEVDLYPHSRPHSRTS